MRNDIQCETGEFYSCKKHHSVILVNVVPKESIIPIINIYRSDNIDIIPIKWYTIKDRRDNLCTSQLNKLLKNGVYLIEG